MTDGPPGVGATLRAGLSDVANAARDCWGALSVAALLSLVSSIGPAGARAPLAILAAVVAQGALFRRAFGRDAGLKGLRWGRDEWRLLAALLMVAALMALICAILMVIVGGVALGVARTAAPDFDPGTVTGWQAAFASAGAAGFVLILVPLASVAILIWLGLRLSFSAPATVERSSVRVLSAFPLTRGRVPALFVVGLAIIAPLLLLRVIVGLMPAGLTGAVLLALGAYFYLAPAWTGSLAHVYRHSMAQEA